MICLKCKKELDIENNNIDICCKLIYQKDKNIKVILKRKHGKTTREITKEEITRYKEQKANKKVEKKTESINYLYSSKKSSSKARGLYFDLTLQEFAKLSYSKCYYCNSEPKNKMKYMARYYNGIDRIDNNYGYTIDNSVPCCKICNMWKGTMGLKEFLKHVNKINKKMN